MAPVVGGLRVALTYAPPGVFIVTGSVTAEPPTDETED